MTDVVARTGDDEFAVILPDADEDIARLVADKLLAEIRRRGSVHQGGRDAP